MDLRENARTLDLEEEEYMDLVSLFIRTSQTSLAELRKALNQRQADQAAAAAHRIKGASLNLGLSEVARFARDIEDEARRGSLQNVPLSVARLGQAINAVSALAEDWQPKTG